ncbi:nicotinate-nucleotide--dimethylbenzimidazole phosphoribosyltransferase [Clostridium sp. SM-530-WT-3G]|uniref:nicotinate-nucleotide--dimethylbenzimidazole phosphoribosyltransferase n=1 Tax=Clostridium sp. SM-530-WT-3G TaxID=2725303 RepID=UPI00145D8B79|nr:nicotinate-nucleotide--dimethylbenzimidazole phosphoribosyltransferase [Clostridium sp. SM-530-WT-3G]NME81916.1 nicotinate-nucleotide--dimethylbenzimidazole phosphoribosyltransferase [Clostridium sp. SM-530-WT-3G]
MNNIELLNSIISNIKDVDKEALKKADERMTSLVKPLKSLGKLEDMAIKLAGITGKVKNNIDKKVVIIMSSDNGVVEEGVASAPQSVTLSQTINFTKGLTGVAVLAKANNTDLMVVDVGVNCDFECPGVINRKVRKSTSNMAKGSAMTYEECIKAVLVGIDCVKDAKDKGYDIVGVGEMGIGNTSTSSAVLCALTDCKVKDVVGRGAGITDAAYAKKISVVKKALEINNPDKNNPLDVISKVGGFDIAAMTGVFIGAAYYKIPVVIDGLISVVAALCAYRLNNKCRDYMFTSHISKEIGFKTAMSELGLSSILDLNMGLGEGSGCPLAFSIMDSACAVMNNMATFEEAEINDKYLDELKRLDNKGV